jgi:hypothetical protein
MSGSQHPAPPATFAALIERLIEQHGTQDAVAKLLGISSSGLGRAGDTMSFQNLIKLAYKAGLDPSLVLRLAGKGEIADMLESVYGPPAAPLSDEDRRLISLPPTKKHAALLLAEDVDDRPPERVANTGASPPRRLERRAVKRKRTA